MGSASTTHHCSPSEESQTLKQKQPSRCLPPGTGLMVIFELGEVSAKSHPSRAVRSSDISSSADDSALVTSFTNRHGRAVTAPGSHPGRVQSSMVRVGRDLSRSTLGPCVSPRTNFHSTSLTGGPRPNSIPESPQQTHPQDANLRIGEDAAPPPKIPFPAEGPLFQPSLALNIDPVPGPYTHPPHSVTPSVSPPAQVSFLCP